MILAQITTSDTVSFGAMFFKTIVALVIIIGLAFFIIKFLLPKITQIRRKNGSVIQVLDFQPLEPRKSIYLIRIEDKKIAVGVSENSITKLAEWEYKA